MYRLNDCTSYKIKLANGKYKCPCCGYVFESCHDLAFYEGERVPMCPECGQSIEDGEDDCEGIKE